MVAKIASGQNMRLKNKERFCLRKIQLLEKMGSGIDCV